MKRVLIIAMVAALLIGSTAELADLPTRLPPTFLPPLILPNSWFKPGGYPGVPLESLVDPAPQVRPSLSTPKPKPQVHTLPPPLSKPVWPVLPLYDDDITFCVRAGTCTVIE
jgi:hypothetical protein